MGMRAAEQQRHATVREELLRVERMCGELVKALSEDVEALGERVTTEVREERERSAASWENLRVAMVDMDLMRRNSLEDEREARQNEDELLRSAHRAFVWRGFWGRVGWLVRGR